MSKDYWDWLDNYEKIHGVGREGPAQSFGAIVWDAAQQMAARQDKDRVAGKVSGILRDVKPCLVESEVRVGEYSNIIKRIDAVLAQQH